MRNVNNQSRTIKIHRNRAIVLEQRRKVRSTESSDLYVAVKLFFRFVL